MRFIYHIIRYLYRRRKLVSSREHDCIILFEFVYVLIIHLAELFQILRHCVIRLTETTSPSHSLHYSKARTFQTNSENSNNNNDPVTCTSGGSKRLVQNYSLSFENKSYTYYICYIRFKITKIAV